MFWGFFRPLTTSTYKMFLFRFCQCASCFSPNINSLCLTTLALIASYFLPWHRQIMTLSFAPDRIFVTYCIMYKIILLHSLLFMDLLCCMPSALMNTSSECACVCVASCSLPCVSLPFGVNRVMISKCAIVMFFLYDILQSPYVLSSINKTLHPRTRAHLFWWISVQTYRSSRLCGQIQSLIPAWVSQTAAARGQTGKVTIRVNLQRESV